MVFGAGKLLTVIHLVMCERRYLTIVTAQVICIHDVVGHNFLYSNRK